MANKVAASPAHKIGHGNVQVLSGVGDVCGHFLADADGQQIVAYDHGNPPFTLDCSARVIRCQSP